MLVCVGVYMCVCIYLSKFEISQFNFNMGTHANTDISVL